MIRTEYDFDYQARLDRVYGVLEDASADAVVLTRNGSVAWLAGVFAPWRSAVVVTEHGPSLITQDIDVNRLREDTWIADVRSWSGRPTFIDVVREFLYEQIASPKRVGVELSGPADLGLLLGAEVLSFQEKDAFQLVDVVPHMNALLVAKDETEVAALREACGIAAAGVESAFEALIPGVTEIEVAGEAERRIRQEGSEWAWSLTGGTEIASGPRTHYAGCICTPPTDREIQSHEFVTLDVHAMHDLYQGEMCTNAFMGQPDDQRLRLARKFSGCLELMMETIKAGVVIKDVAQEVVRYLDRENLLEMTVPVWGHGLGTTARIPPIIGTWNRSVFTERMTLVLLLQVNTPNGGLRAEYPVVVRADRAEPLVKMSHELMIKEV